MGKVFSSNESENKRWLNDSFFSQFKYKFYIHKRKFPVIFEDYFGLNLRYCLLLRSIGNNLVPVWWFRLQFEAKNCIVEGESDLLIEKYFISNNLKVDDILELNSGHRAVHLAVLFDDEELLDYLVKEDAHLMARDWNGYTPLLKAAALGRLNICKKLIEAGVPPFHKDPWGISPLEKAALFKQSEVVEYFQNLDKNINKEKIEVWNQKKFKENYKLGIWYMKQF
jgi:hypothetical protein